MRLSCRRLLSLSVSLVVASSPLAAQWIGSTRTFESVSGCATGTLEWLYDPATRELTARRGPVFCSRLHITVGQLASENAYVARVAFSTTVPEPGLDVHPYWDWPIPWLSLSRTDGPEAGSGSHAPSSALEQIDTFDVLLGYVGPRLPTPNGDLRGFALRGWWRARNSATISFPGQHEAHNTALVGSLVETTVPEPSTWALMATGLLAIGGVATRRKRAS